MSNKMRYLFSLLLLLPFPLSLQAQIKENVARYQEGNGTGYIQPLVDGLAVSMNRGWYHSGYVPTIGLRVKLTVIGMIAPIPDDDRTFMATTEGLFQPQTTAEVPTIVGNEKSVTITGEGGTKYTFPGGLNLDMTGFAVPQLTVGSFMGTEATFRFFTSDFGDSELGDLQLFGIGIRHSLSQYLILAPVDFSVGIFYQNIDVGDNLLQFNTWHFGAQASRGFGILSLYGGIGFDNSSASIDYEYTDEEETASISYDIDGDSGLEITLGAGLNFFLLHLYTDYTFGNRSVFSFGLSLGL